MTSKLDIEALNQLDVEAFTNALQDIFEHSPWIPMKAHAHAPFSNTEELRSAMVEEVNKASVKAKKKLLCAHPQLAGKEAAQGGLTQASEAEQASVGLNALSSDEMEKVRELNTNYLEKFGFPFMALPPIKWASFA